LGGELAPLLPRALEEDALDLGVRVRARGVELPLDQVLAPDAVAPGLPELGLQRTQGHPAITAGVGPVADEPARQLELAALRHLAVGQVAARHERQPRQRAVEHRHVHDLPLPGAVALLERREDSERRHQRASADIGDLSGRLDRRPVLLAGQPEQPV
jgi:hypothetical protein